MYILADMARESLPGHLKRPDYEGADPSYTFFCEAACSFSIYSWGKSGLFS
ncbi:hypothetical protein EXIGUO9Y_130005 [Exiguobacterium oxidotolerans]|uniref:Uncharacterized protein n=1 Tax=Exiguobacterium oxidotolerans TaxID=223958 RepID=A0A653I4P2_9BACL|nr:hypothetical protein EXIGUO9Y_130005 [Exiguobacterium oxidotolerans]